MYCNSGQVSFEKKIKTGDMGYRKRSKIESYSVGTKVLLLGMLRKPLRQRQLERY